MIAFIAWLLVYAMPFVVGFYVAYRTLGTWRAQVPPTPWADRLAAVSFGSIAALAYMMVLMLFVVVFYFLFPHPVTAAVPPEPAIRYVVITTTPPPPCLSKQ